MTRYFRSSPSTFMMLLGLGLIIIGIALGIYVGFYLCFIKGIAQVIGSITPTIVPMGIAWGVGKIMFAAFFGWLAALVLILPGMALVKVS